MERYHGPAIRTGLVVMVDSRLNSQIRGAVLDVEELLATGFLTVRGISQEAFALPSAKMNLELSTRKNLIRRLEKPLIFGNLIEYNMEEDLDKRGMIKSFERLKDYLKSRIHEGEGQILLDGVVNPTDPGQLFTNYFRNVSIPVHLQKEASPNVYVEAWVTLYYRENVKEAIGSVEYEFHSFNGVCSLERQYDVGLTPWNKNNPHYALFEANDDDDDDEYGGFGVHIANPKKRLDRPDLELYKREAYMTGDRSFLLCEFHQYKCMAPLKKYEANLQPGNLYLVDCFWNTFEKTYMISKIVASKKMDTLATDPESKLLRCSVSEHHKYRGIFKSKLFGIMDDPSGILAFLHLTKNHGSSVPVTILDDGPSRCGQLRFRIMKVLGDKAEKLQKFLEEKIIISDAAGVVIDNSFVFSAGHSPLSFEFRSEDKPPAAGVQIKFSAEYDIDKKKFYIISWEKKPNSNKIQTEVKRMMKSNNESHMIFQVRVRRCPEPEFDKMFCCDEFGIIDDNLGIITINGQNNDREFEVWVTRSHSEMHEFIPRTPYNIVASGTDIPTDRYKESIANAKDAEAKREFYLKLVKAQIDYDLSFKRRQNERDDKNMDDSRSASSVRTAASGYSQMSNAQNGENQRGNWPSLSGHHSKSEYHNSGRASSVSSLSGHGSMIGEDSNLNLHMKNFNIHDDRSSQSSHYGNNGNENHAAQYTGPVLADDNAEQQFDVVETLSRLKRYVHHHPDCGSICHVACPYLTEVARLVARESGFWEEAQQRYPAIVVELVRCINRVDTCDRL